MGDRASQITSEWFAKCATVVVQARVVTSCSEKGAKRRTNPWVRTWDTPCYDQKSSSS